MSLVALLAPAIIGAQEPDSSCSPAPVPGIVIDKTAYLILQPLSAVEESGPDGRQAHRMRLMLEGVQRSFEAPPLITVRPSLPEVLEDSDDPSSVHSTFIDGRIVFTAHADGSVSDARLDRASAAPAIDSAVVRALVRAAADWHIGVFAFETSADGQAPSADSVTFFLRVSTEQDSATIAFPLAVLTLDAYRVKHALLAPGNAPPPYPEDLLRRRIEGKVLLELIVGENGRADMSSIRVIEATHTGFTFAVRRHLPMMRYFPAEIGGCLVRMRIKQPFTFHISP